MPDPLDDGHGDVLWSGGGDELDRFAIFETMGGGNLTFDTLYDLEAFWDFGIVQVSTDSGASWTTLSNADTTSDHDPNAAPNIVDELPGFTGDSGGWQSESFDLSAYAGQPILVGFRFMSDAAANGNGVLDDPNWYLDNVAIDAPATDVSDGSDTSVFKSLAFYQPIPVDFNVDLVSLPRAGSYGNSSFKVLHLMSDDATEVASASQIRQALRDSQSLVLVITYDAPQGVADYATYDLSFTYR